MFKICNFSVAEKRDSCTNSITFINCKWITGAEFPHKIKETDLCSCASGDQH
jgi:hypothetical protein